MVRPTPVKPRKEELFMRVVVDDEAVFLNLTSHVGRISPYKTKVKSTCAVRVSDNVVAYSVMQVTKASSKRLGETPLQIPRKTLSLLESRALELDKAGTLPKDEVLLYIDGEEFRFTREVDDAGVLTLEPQFEDEAFELPARALRMDIYMRSHRVDRILAVSFSGHLDRRAGESETRTRATLKAINNLLALANFHLLTDFSATNLPLPPSGPPVAPRRKAGDRVVFSIPVNLFTADEIPALVASGSVTGEVDLDHANASTGQLLYHLSPSPEIEASFPVYRENLLNAIVRIMLDHLPDSEQRNISYDIVLGEVSAGAIERLREATEKLGALDLTPTQFRQRG